MSITHHNFKPIEGKELFEKANRLQQQQKK
jgi:hypothetical protein